MKKATARNTRTLTENFVRQTVGKLRGRMGKTKGKNMFTSLLAAVEPGVVVEAATGLKGSLHIGLAALGSAIGVGIIGMKAAEATGRNPGAAGAIRNQAIIFAALAEGVVFFAIFLAR